MYASVWDREKNYDRVWPCINISFGYPFQLCPKKNMTISNLSHSLIVSQANICEEDLYSINTLMVTKMDDMQTPFFIVELYEFWWNEGSSILLPIFLGVWYLL